MINTKITIVCTHGRNLSKYLKEHLMEKGIKSHAVGLYFKNLATIQKIKNAKTIICVHPEIQKEVEAEFDLTKKYVICLNVSDCPNESGTSKNLTGDVWLEYQKEYVYPALESQIKKYLKKLA
ncbi:hypothetical protein HN358_01205 [Candidatus Uhrbacteria bacterium]|nr:hypothetical protein [Candidatus Uhrbacteria bacterium]MBT7717350.1 hypothetical protein [Candidatus Uhrbacteria bacterium]